MKKVKICEHDHQKAVIEWARLMAKHKYPVLKWLYAIPNGALLGKDPRQRAITMSKLKAEGLNTDVPDLCLPYPMKRNGPVNMGERLWDWWHGLYIEMKSKDTKGSIRPGQQEWLDYLESVGYRVKTAWTSKEATDTIEEYLSGN